MQFVKHTYPGTYKTNRFYIDGRRVSAAEYDETSDSMRRKDSHATRSKNLQNGLRRVTHCHCGVA
jgi:hypothetical protein